MSINHPVTRPDQMRKPLVWNPISDEWRNGLVESKTWWCKEVIPQPSSDREKRAMDSALRLRDKLCRLAVTKPAWFCMTRTNRTSWNAVSFLLERESNTVKGFPVSATIIRLFCGRRIKGAVKSLRDMRFRKTACGVNTPGSYSL